MSTTILPPETRKVSVSGILTMMKNWNQPKNGKEFAYDIAELIDNSIDAKATEIRIGLQSHKLSVVDNGMGMTTDQLSTALDIGYSSKKDCIGRYGVGMKITSLRIADNYTIQTINDNNLCYTTGICSSEMRPEIITGNTSKVNGTSIVLNLKKNMYKKRWMRDVFETLSLIYSPVLATGEVKIHLNARTLEPTTFPVDPFFTASFKSLVVTAFVSDNFVKSDSYLYRGTYVYLIGKRCLTTGTDYLIEDLTLKKYNYDDLRVMVGIIPGPEISASTNKSGFIIETDREEYSEFLSKVSEEITQTYIKIKEEREKEVKDKKVEQALKQMSKLLSKTLQELNESLELFKEGSYYTEREEKEVNPEPKKQDAEDRKEREDKGSGRSVKLELAKAPLGENNRCFQIERVPETNLFKVILNTDHAYFQKIIEDHDTVNMPNFMIGMAPNILTEVSFYETDHTADEFKDRTSHMQSKLSGLMEK